MRAVTVLSTAFAVCAATAIVTANRPAETPFAAIDTALSCQAKVVDKVRKDAGGKVFLTFDRMPSIDGSNVSGNAMDRSFDKKDRAMSYKCAGATVSYSYNDGKAPAKFDGSWPSGAARACESQAGGGFAAASLSASDTSAEYVIGVAGNGSAKICTMDRQKVVSIK